MAKQISAYTAQVIDNAANQLVNNMNIMVDRSRMNKRIKRQDDIKKFGVLLSLPDKATQKAFLEAYPYTKGTFMGMGGGVDQEKTQRLLDMTPSVSERETRAANRAAITKRNLQETTATNLHSAQQAAIKSRFPKSYTLSDGTIVSQDDLLSPGFKDSYRRSVLASGEVPGDEAISSFYSAIEASPTREKLLQLIMGGDPKILSATTSPGAYRNVYPRNESQAKGEILRDTPSLYTDSLKASIDKVKAETAKAKRPQLKTLQNEVVRISNIPPNFRTSMEDDFIERYKYVEDQADRKLAVDQAQHKVDTKVKIYKANLAAINKKERLALAKERVAIALQQLEVYSDRTLSTEKIQEVTLYSKQLETLQEVLTDPLIVGANRVAQKAAKEEGLPSPETLFSKTEKKIEEIESKIKKLLTKEISKEEINDKTLEDKIIENNIRLAPTRELRNMNTSSFITDDIPNYTMNELTDLLIGAE